MKLAINLGLSLAMLGMCLYLVWPNAAEQVALRAAFAALTWQAVVRGLVWYLAAMLVVQLARALRWNALLAPLGVTLPAGRMLAISSVGFLAILALPARLGELVRPALIRHHGHLTVTTALGSVFLERLFDGLFVATMVTVAFASLTGPGSPPWMMPSALLALGIFGGISIFLLVALRWPQASIRLAVRSTLLPFFAPRLGRLLEAKLTELLQGCKALHAPRHMLQFALATGLYWLANAIALWGIAPCFALSLSYLGAMAATGLLALGLVLPNAPGNAGQFQWVLLLGLQTSLGVVVANNGASYGQALALAIAHYALQVAWYLAWGVWGLMSPWASWQEVKAARREFTPSGPPTR